MSRNKNDHLAAAKKAVIYCRVSGAKQVREGDGLASQETRCREYAKYKGYEVARIFRDDITGKLATRPAMQEMLTYLRRHKAQGRVVIIDDISRLARGLEAHLHLRTSLANAGGKLESPSIEFGEDSDSILVENLLASVAQHQREKNGEQTLNRMRARMQNGYWVFHAPIGYKYAKTKTHGKLLVRNEPLAGIVAEALEGYALGRYETQAEIKRFLESRPAFPKNEKGEVPQQRVTDILTRPVYAGYITHENWDLNLVPARHEPLVTLEIWQRVQQRRSGTAKAPTRKNINADFPLRGFVLCGDCDKPLTACWSTGAKKKYPYYLCDTKGCVSYRKSIRREKIEGEFEVIVQSLKPAPGLFALVKTMFKEAWGQRRAQAADMKQRLERDIVRLEKDTAKFLDRIVDATNSSVIAAYEDRIARLETDKAVATEKLREGPGRQRPFDEMFEQACLFLSNPWKLWASGQFHLKRILLRLAFTERIAYDRNSGYRTPEFSIPINYLKDLSMHKNEMVPRRRLELPRPCGHRYLKPARLPIPPPGLSVSYLRPPWAIVNGLQSASISTLYMAGSRAYDTSGLNRARTRRVLR